MVCLLLKNPVAAWHASNRQCSGVGVGGPSLSSPFKSMVILTSLDGNENARRPGRKTPSSVNEGGGENRLESPPSLESSFGAEQPLTGANTKGKGVCFPPWPIGSDILVKCFVKH